jgi:hypothetical protein
MNRLEKGWFSRIAVTLLLITATASFAFGQATSVRWDIISRNFDVVPIEDSAGGVAAALAQDGSLILLTGHGTFTIDAGRPFDVTGGGTWATSGPVGTASGTYQVTERLRWQRAPGTPPPFTDLIGNPANRSPGLAVLRIAYSDGTTGTLVVSCHLVGTPDSVFEGITASKGFVDFFDRVHDTPNVDANRTLFHVR